MKSAAKREWFLFIPLFLRERKIDVKKFSLSERFFCSRAAFKSRFFLRFLMVMRFDYDIVLVLGLFWWELKVSNSKFEFNANLEIFDQFC